MLQQEFSIEIRAPKERVWEVLWNDATFRDWANIIDEGMYMKGELIEGEEVQFISGLNGYGVTSLVTRLIPCEFISFKQMRDTQESGASVREDEWTGGEESYSLVEQNGMTILTERTDVPPQLEEIMKERIPKALARIKELSEVPMGR